MTDAVELLIEAVEYAEDGDGAWLKPEKRAGVEYWLKGAPARGDLIGTAITLMTFVNVLQENGCERAAVELLDLATPLTPHLREIKVDEAQGEREANKQAFEQAVGSATTSRAPMAESAPKADVKGKVKKGLR
jgi:hypothetical protein